MTDVFRLSRALHADFNGIGASVQPGRWNLAGDRVVYTAGNRALAVLEAFAHLGHARPVDYVFRKATIPDEVRITFPPDHPVNYDGFVDALDNLHLSRRIGSQWLADRESAVLAVPSALVRQEFNFLLNPAHPDFPLIVLSEPEQYRFDERLWKASQGPFC